MFFQNIHIFTVIIPLLMGFLSFVIKDKRLLSVNRLYFVFLFIFFSFVLYSIFKLHLLNGNDYSVVIGGWKKAMGIEIKYNLNCAFAILAMTLVLLIFFANGLSEITYAVRGFACIMFCGANGIVITNDIFNTYVFFEIICITTYIYYSHSNDKICLKNAYNYMILSGFVGVIFLFVASLLYQITGNLNLDLIYQNLYFFINNKAVNAVFVLFILSMMFKMGLYPLHNIVFEIYKRLSLRYLILVAGISSIAYPFFIIKFITNLFGSEILLNNEYLSVCLKIFGAIGFIFFNLTALSSTYVLNFIISLSLAQTALFAFCIPFTTSKQVVNGLIFAFTSHTLVKVCMFALLYKIQNVFHNMNIRRIDVSIISSVVYKILFVLLLYFISGMPFSLVFISKWYLLVGIFNTYTNIVWLCALVIGFGIDIFACFMFIKQILVKNDNKKVDIDNDYIIIFTILFIILFLVITSFFVGYFL